ncbi:hypothetical protein COCNU_scaffold000125G000010 [Cocos nucifera]|nr:hypothetical protein [Cocos nucifera]
MADLDQMELVWRSLGTILKITVLSSFLSRSSFLYLDIICLWQSGHQVLAHLKRRHRQEVEALKVQEDLQAEINCLQEKAAEAERFMKEKAAELESL